MIVVLAVVLVVLCGAGFAFWATTVAANRREHAENERARADVGTWGEAREWTPTTELRTFAGRWALSADRPDAPVARFDGRHRDHDVAVVVERAQAEDGRSTVAQTTCLVHTEVDLPRLRVTAVPAGRDRGRRLTGDPAFDEALTVRCDGPPGEVVSGPVRELLLRQVPWLPAEPSTLLRTPGRILLLTHEGFHESADLDALVDDAVDIAEQLATGQLTPPAPEAPPPSPSVAGDVPDEAH